MTREEAKAILENLEYELSNQVASEYCRKKYEAIKMAIKALEQQPCEDCVSRKATLEELQACVDTESIYDENNGLTYICYDDAVKFIEDLPSITPIFPKGMTNGDMLTALFGKKALITLDTHNYLKDWWNAPYEKGVE